MAGDFDSGSSHYGKSSLTQNTKLYGGNANGFPPETSRLTPRWNKCPSGRGSLHVYDALSIDWEILPLPLETTNVGQDS